MRALNGIVGKKLQNVVGRSCLKLSKHSPELLLCAGIAGMIAAAVMAVRKERNQAANSVYWNHGQRLEEIREDEKIFEGEVAENVKPEDANGMSPQAARREKIKLYARTAAELGYIYWKPIGLGVASIGCIVGGHVIMKKRYVGVMAAYGLVQEAFGKYRKRVREVLGDDADRKFMYDTEEKVAVKEIVDENGKKKKIKETTQVLRGKEVSQYAVIFDHNNHQWSEHNREFNWLYLNKVRNYVNDIMHSRGHIFLNEVYDELGFPHTSAGSVVGWLHGTENGGDNYVSFGPWCETMEQVEDADEILLDFNVDGVIWDKI